MEPILLILFHFFLSETCFFCLLFVRLQEMWSMMKRPTKAEAATYVFFFVKLDVFQGILTQEMLHYLYHIIYLQQLQQIMMNFPILTKKTPSFLRQLGRLRPLHQVAASGMINLMPAATRCRKSEIPDIARLSRLFVSVFLGEKGSNT